MNKQITVKVPVFVTVTVDSIIIDHHRSEVFKCISESICIEDKHFPVYDVDVVDFKVSDTEVEVVTETYIDDSEEELVYIKLSRIVNNDHACEMLGVNPYCINEGLADSTDTMPVTVRLAKLLGLI